MTTDRRSLQTGLCCDLSLAVRRSTLDIFTIDEGIKCAWTIVHLWHAQAMSQDINTFHKFLNIEIHCCSGVEKVSLIVIIERMKGSAIGIAFP